MPRSNWISERLRGRRTPLACVVALLLAGAPLGAQTRPTDALAWLTGCWERRTATAHVEEHWSSAAGGMLLGFAKTTVRDSVREYEFTRVYAIGDTLVYHALPSRQRGTEFRAVPPFDSLIAFENPAHDFPQRIIYRRVGADSMHARIEGTRNGQVRGVDYPFARAACR